MDASLALQGASQNDLVRRKLEMDALRRRLGDTRTEREKLREACEGFESIFIQKLWEQMRKTVPKEGYLHSKDEETYQSLFDVELAKKMASAGGIGLADMLYAQLSQQLERTARATTAGAGKNPLPAGAAALKPAPPAETAAALREEDLYSPLKAGEEAEEPSEDENDLARALKEIRADLEEPVPPSEKGAAIRAELAAGLPSSGREADGPEAAAEGSPPEKSSGFRSATWQREGLVSARPKPASSLGRREVQAVQENTGAPETAPSGGRSRGLPQEAGLWPHEGKVLSPFGRTEDADGGRRWNSGLTLEGIPGDPVRAVMDGTVLFSGRREGYGQTIILEHRGGLLSYYGNVRSANLKVGDAVARGTEFAEIQAQDSPAGEKENSAPLFFALKRGEVALDPEKVLGRPSAGEKSASR